MCLHSHPVQTANVGASCKWLLQVCCPHPMNTFSFRRTSLRPKTFHILLTNQKCHVHSRWSGNGRLWLCTSLARTAGKEDYLECVYLNAHQVSGENGYLHVFGLLFHHLRFGAIRRRETTRNLSSFAGYPLEISVSRVPSTKGRGFSLENLKKKKNLNETNLCVVCGKIPWIRTFCRLQNSSIFANALERSSNREDPLSKRSVRLGRDTKKYLTRPCEARVTIGASRLNDQRFASSLGYATVQ